MERLRPRDLVQPFLRDSLGQPRYLDSLEDEERASWVLYGLTSCKDFGNGSGWGCGKGGVLTPWWTV